MSEAHGASQGAVILVHLGIYRYTFVTEVENQSSGFHAVLEISHNKGLTGIKKRGCLCGKIIASVTLICFVLTIRHVPICPCKLHLISFSYFQLYFPMFLSLLCSAVFCSNVFLDEVELNYSNGIWIGLYQQNLWVLQSRNLYQSKGAPQAWLNLLIWVKDLVAGTSSRDTHACLVNGPV